ncbi:MAG: DUF4097 domain-containing protein [Defluviitaleaceae bacterium]|nr:DUF4097 domain-containing protein [Defluviitaleaceae bacterium]
MKKIGWIKIALVLIVMGVGFMGVGWLAGFRGGAMFFESGRFHVYEPTIGTTFIALEHVPESLTINTVAVHIVIETIPAGEFGDISLINIEPELLEITETRVSIGTGRAERRTGLQFFNFRPRLTGPAALQREIRIRLPEDADLSDAHIASISGRVQVSGLNAAEIEARSISGSVTVNNSHAESLTIVSTSGTVRAEDISWQTLHAQSVSGSVHVTGEIIPSQQRASHLRSTSGSVNLTLANTFGEFGYNAESLSGTVRVNGENRGRSAAARESGDDHIVTVRTTSGSVRLDF